MIEKIRPGQKIFKTPIFNSTAMNKVFACADAFNDRSLGGLGAGTSRPLKPPSFKVRNNSGDPLLRGHCLQVGASLVTPIDFRNGWFAADVPADPLRGCVLLQQATPDGEIGPANATGQCCAIIDVTDTDHQYANPVAGEVVLSSATFGMFEILSPLGSTGEQEVWVRFATPPSTDIVSLQSADSDTALTGTPEVMAIGGSSPVLPSWMTIVSDEMIIEDEAIGGFLMFSGCLGIKRDAAATEVIAATITLEFYDAGLPGFAALWQENLYLANDDDNDYQRRSPTCSWGPIKSGDKFRVIAAKNAGTFDTIYYMGGVNDMRLDVQLIRNGRGYGTRSN